MARGRVEKLKQMTHKIGNRWNGHSSMQEIVKDTMKYVLFSRVSLSNNKHHITYTTPTASKLHKAEVLSELYSNSP